MIKKFFFVFLECLERLLEEDYMLNFEEIVMLLYIVIDDEIDF